MPPSSDATLSALTLMDSANAEVTLTPTFVSSMTSYAAGVSHGVTSVTVAPTVNQEDATFVVRVGGVDDEDRVIDLKVGENVITVLVTAENGSTKTYTVIVTLAQDPVLSVDFGWNAVDDFNTLAVAGNGYPVGIWSNGETMWVADSTDEKLYAYNLSDKARDASRDFNTLAAAGNTNPTGIWSDGETMWVADSGDDKLYAYRMANKARDNTKDFDALDDDGNASPGGLWSNGTTIWVANGINASLDAYALATKTRDDSKDFDTGVLGSTISTGLWSDGETMWVVATPLFSPNEAKIYAYDLKTKVRVPGDDFGTLVDAGNTNPYGIWSDGETMWVADYTDEKLYAYNMPPSADATLSALSVDGVDIRDFDPATTEYDVGVAHSVSQVTVAATAQHTGATIGIDGTAVASGAGHPVALTEGLNTVTITVSAPGGNTTLDYIIRVGRGVTADYGWKAVDDFNTLYAARNTNPWGIWSDGLTMWVADFVDKKIYAYDLANKERDASKDFDTLARAGNYTPYGLWSDGETMWVVDRFGAKLEAYDMVTKARVLGQDFDTLVAAGNASLRGIWSDGTTIWVADGRDAKLYAYRMETKARDETKDFDTLHDAGNTLPRGIWSDGTTMWVVDASRVQPDRTKIYAYNLATKARVPGQDFDTLRAAGNAAPQGIWSDGVTMWATNDNIDDTDGNDGNDGNNKVYSYNMPNPSLRSISIDGVELPGVTRGRTAYSHSVNSEARTVTVAAEAAHSGATVTRITPADSSGDAGHQVDLNRDGETATTVTISVTAEDGATTRKYTVEVGFRPADPQPSLRGLRLDYGGGPGTHEILIGPCSRFPESSDLPYCTGREPSINEFHVDAGTAGLVTVIARTTRESETVAFKTEYGSTLTANIPDEDPAAGGHQVKLAGRGTSLSIDVVVSNRDGLQKGYKIRVTRQLSGDTRLGQLTLSHSGSGRLLEHDLRFGNRPPSNLDPAFNSFWDRVKERPQTARYRATLLLPAETASGTPDSAVLTVRAKERHAGSSMRLYGDYFDRDLSDGFQVNLDSGSPQSIGRVQVEVEAENGDLHIYELVIVKRYETGGDAVLVKKFKGVNEWDGKTSLFVDWQDAQSCDKRYYVATEYVAPNGSGWFDHPATKGGVGDAERRTYLWLDMESMESAFGPRTDGRTETTIEVWCGPRPYWVAGTRYNTDSRLVGSVAIELPDEPAPKPPPDEPDPPTGRLSGDTATLSWNKVEGARSYELGVWWDGRWRTDFAAIGLTAKVGDGTATVSDLPDPETFNGYFFRVRAVNTKGASDWSGSTLIGS